MNAVKTARVAYISALFVTELYAYRLACKVFAEYGTVSRVQLPTDRETGRARGFGFVEMESSAAEDAAIAALDGAEWMGRAMKVNKARPREEKGSRSGGGGGNWERGNRRY